MLSLLVSISLTFFNFSILFFMEKDVKTSESTKNIIITSYWGTKHLLADHNSLHMSRLILCCITSCNNYIGILGYCWHYFFSQCYSTAGKLVPVLGGQTRHKTYYIRFVYLKCFLEWQPCHSFAEMLTFFHTIER